MGIPSSRIGNNELELPPTPVQLGVEAPPERPKGLSSSSPRGSKSGSGRRRTRALNGQSVTSSPLKPKAPAPMDLESQSEAAREALESQAPEPEPEVEADSESEEVPKELREKSKTIRNLRLELRKLKAEIRDAEAAMSNNDLPDDITADDTLIKLFKTVSMPASFANGDFEQDTTPKVDSSFLTLFAPGNLQLQTKMSTKLIKGHAKVVHQLWVTAPAPWPARVFSADFEVITDAEEVAVEKVTWVDVLKGRTQACGVQHELHSWIQGRLKSELHRLDIGGIIWGIGTYFMASVERAKTFPDFGKEIQDYRRRH